MKKKLFPNIKTLTSVFSFAILLVTVVMLMLRLTVFSPYKENTNGNGEADVTEQTTDQIEFKYTIKDEIVFKDFGATANPQIESDSSNEHIMQVKIIREDNKALIYSSDYIKPGFNKRTMKLEGQPMEAGEYLCKAEITVMDMDSSEPIELINEPVTVIIENNLPDER